MADLEDLHEVFSDPRAMQYWDSLPYADISQTRHLLEGMVALPAAESDDYVVELAGRAIGKAGCWQLGEIGVILHPADWGKGYAREALAAIIPDVFARRHVSRLVADIDPRNTASIRLFESLGFVEYGRAANTIRVGDQWCDSVYLALERKG